MEFAGKFTLIYRTKITDMKKLTSLIIIALFAATSVFAQQDLRRKINVSGSAEMEVTPDIIYVGISLKEYFKDNNNKNKVDIAVLENQLYQAALKAGIAKSDIMINNINAWSQTISKKKGADFLASKQYRLKVSDLNKLDAIIDAIDSKGIQNTNIESYDYSKIESLKRDLKIKALLNAKEKASYLVEALGDKLGSAIEIHDGGDNVMPPVYRSYMMKAEMASADMAAPADLDFKKIKLNFSTNVVFEIK